MLYSLFQSAFFRWVALQPKRSSLIFPFSFYRYLVDGLPSVWNGIAKSCNGLPSVWNGIVKSCNGLPSVWNGTVKSYIGLPSVCNSIVKSYIGLPIVWNGIVKSCIGLPIVWSGTSKIVVGVSQQFQPKEYVKTAFLLPIFQRLIILR